jgi:lysozyme family protein
MIGTGRFKLAFDIVVDHEGGYNDIKADRGGATNFGVSLAFIKSRGLVYDFNRDGVIDKEDIRRITRDDAATLYLNQFWDVTRCDDLPNGMALLMFDAAVNSGPAQAVKWLQAVLGVTPDGVMGPVTVRAAQKAPLATMEQMHLLRMRFMTQLPGWPAFGKGWSMRMVQIAFQARSFA